MSTSLSVAEILANLEARLAFHRQQAELHAQQEAIHREQRAVHTAESEKVSQHLEAFRSVAVAAAELAVPPAPPPPDEAGLGESPQVSRLVARVVESRPAQETFGASSIVEEVNRRYAAKLRRPIDSRIASVVLRRLRDGGRIHLVREGKAHHEALYATGPQPARGR